MAITKTNRKNQGSSSYSAKDIYVLEGLDPVRKRPGMYIGSTGVDGLHHLIWEVVDNSIDEAMAGFATLISVELKKDNVVRVQDDGRGIPVDIHPQTKKSALETALCTLHAGGKFGGESYKVSGGLHGVGVSVVNALSIWLKAEVERDGGKFVQEYKRGIPTAKVKRVGASDRRGTTITFQPDSTILQKVEFDDRRILEHLRQQAYLTKGVRIEFVDARGERPISYGFHFEGGLQSFVWYLLGDRKPIHDHPFYIEKEQDDIEIEATLVYTNEVESEEMSFANNIYTPDGGMHLTGFRAALTRTLNDYARSEGYLKEAEENLTGDDIREGLVAAVSIKIREPQFEGQTKARLGNPGARPAVETVVAEGLKEFLGKHGTDARRIIEKNLLAAKSRKAAKAAKDTVLRKGALEGLTLPGKLADCSSRNASESELFIVEGDSAGGCFAGDTEVALADGRNLSFRELVRESTDGKKNYCYTITKNGLIELREIVNPRRTKKNTRVVKVVLDNDREIVCTPDHRFMLSDGRYRRADQLQPSDSLMPLYRQESRIGKRITIAGYEMVFDPGARRWLFTHVLADAWNLTHHRYAETAGTHRHHLDFNKRNNNPENLVRLTKEEHMGVHRLAANRTLRRPDVLKKLRIIRQSPEFREKIRRAMLAPNMRRLLSERARHQWENPAYKEFMAARFREFYRLNPEYRESNATALMVAQREYWKIPENRDRQSRRTRQYFQDHPERKQELSTRASTQWSDETLVKWRRERTRKQWTPAFRSQRVKTYAATYLRKALSILRSIYDRTGIVDWKRYEQVRKVTNDKSLLKSETILERFFNHDQEKLVDAIRHFNHKVRAVVPLKMHRDVYDLEVPGTHNFALADGVFVHNSAKQGRDRRFQAILPLKGKILNVEKARIDKMLQNKEVRALVIALGTAISDSFDITKLRYHKVILMSDADVDGAHIRTLLLTLFFRYFQEIISSGYLYIAQPPLYRVQRGKEVRYAHSEKERNKYVDALGQGATIQRYKGLGEMNPQQLWETTLDPAVRLLRRVDIQDAAAADRLFDVLMGEAVEPRKKFIQAHAASVQDLDV
ncbi:MAG: DNA topoisomerase (ATP-hydrolyzing) subunit B [bacterium]|nr:DNA topoisomerase (ATP-hydrolyzing) subunit B [bacterium]